MSLGLALKLANAPLLKGVGVLPETSSLLARMSPQPAYRRTAINNLIRAAKAHGWWAQCDGIYDLAATDATSRNQNWKSASYTATDAGAATLIANRGTLGTGAANSYLNTHFTPSSAVSPKYTLNSAHQCLFIRRAPGSATSAYMLGAGKAVAGYRNSGQVHTRSNVASTTSTAVAADPPQIGQVGWSRYDAAFYQVFFKGALIASPAVVSTGVDAQPFSTPSAPDLGVYPTDEAVLFATFGGALSDAGSTVLMETMCTDITAYIAEVNRQFPSAIALCVDDVANLSYAQSVWALAKARGIPLSFAINTRSISAPTWTAINALVAEGVDICSHSRGHSDLTATVGMTVKYNAGGAVALLTVTNTDFTVVVDGVTDFTLPISGGVLMSALVAALNATGRYTAVVSSTLINTLAANLATVAGVDVKTSTYSAALDATKFYADEVAGSKADIEANILGYTCKTMVAPYNNNNSTSRAAIKAAGYLGSRGNQFGYTDLSNTQVFELYSNTCPSEVPVASIAANAAAMVSQVRTYGLVKTIYAHTTAEYTLQNWADLLDGLVAAGATFKNLTQIITDVRANGTDADGTGYRWVRN